MEHKVTLVVPVCNMEQYLPWRVESLLAQTCREYEILLIEDGSADSCSALCGGYAEPHPDFVQGIHKENGGLSSVWNAVINAVQDEFVVFSDPDDRAEPDCVEKLLRCQREHRADLVCLGHCVDANTTSSPAMSDREAPVLLPPKKEGFSWNKLYRLLTSSF